MKTINKLISKEMSTKVNILGPDKCQYWFVTSFLLAQRFESPIDSGKLWVLFQSGTR